MVEEMKKERKMGDVAGFSGVEQKATMEETMESKDQSSGTSRSTIGNTFIPSEERMQIRDDVRVAVHQRFPGIHMSTVHNSGHGKPDDYAVDMTNHGQNSAPMAIAGSDVSVASTSNNGGNAVEFSPLSQ